MNNVERIRHTIDLQENKEDLKNKMAFIEEELEKVIREEISHQGNCSHVAFRFGGTENTKGFVKCLLCGSILDIFNFMVLKNLDLTVDANAYRDEKRINMYNYKFEELCESLFDIFQNKFLELSEKYPEKDTREIVEVLSEMIKNDEQKELIQSLDKPLLSKTNGKKILENKDTKGIIHHSQG